MVHRLSNIQKIFVFGVVFSFLLPFLAHGQILGDDLVVEANPVLPRAYESIDFTLSSFSFDLSRSQISWRVGGELKQEGVGKINFTTTTGALGSSLIIDVVVRQPNGGKVSRQVVLRPAEVDILWQAHTYTPPLYKGKALASPKSLLKITALPHLITSKGVPLSPSNLIYTWEQDGVVLGSLSGFGKDSIVVQGGRLSRTKTAITVSVSSFDETLKAKDSVSIRAYDPFILFYEKHPLEGIKYERSLEDTFSLGEKEVTFRAEPYFFSLDDIVDGELDYQWKVGGKKVNPTSKDKRELTLRREGEGEGVAQVELKIENFNRLLQLAENSLRVLFGKSNPGIF